MRTGFIFKTTLKKSLKSIEPSLLNKQRMAKRWSPKENPKMILVIMGMILIILALKMKAKKTQMKANKPRKPKETQTKPKPSNHLTNEPSNQENNNICRLTANLCLTEKPKENLKMRFKEVFEFWKVTFNKNNRTVLDNPRKSKIQARLKEGYTVEDIKTAIVGCSKSQFHIEGNHTDLTLICRDATKLDHFLCHV